MEIQGIFDLHKEKALALRSEPISARIKRLKTLKKWIYDNRAIIQDAVYADLNKPKEEVDLTEIYVVLSEVKKAIRNLRYWVIPEPEGTSIPFIGTKAEIYYEPKGRVLIISPWNYPFSLALLPMIAAIASGNTIFMKPSELSENTSALIDKMAQELFGDDMVKVVTGGVEKSTELLALAFDHVFFTGSPRVGKIVMEAASKHLASVTLELGGKSPCVVDKSANIKDATEKLAWGKWLNAGQTCLAPDYFLVHDEVKDEFLEGLKQEAEKMYGGQDYSCIINSDHYDRLKNWKQEAIEQGAVVYHDSGDSEENRRMGPCILLDPKAGTHLDINEIFGPVCIVKTYTNLDEVIDMVNSRPKALSAYIFSRNKKVVNEFKKRTSAGTFVINDNVLQFGHPTLPFGGVNNSGIGKSKGKYGFLAFSNQKSVLKQRVGFTMAKILYPPYNQFKRLNIDLLLKYF